VLLFRGLQFSVVLGRGLPSMAVLELFFLRVRARREEEGDEPVGVEEAIWRAGHGEERGA
jgi:hypothetical protein